MRLLFGAFLVGHGLIHASYFSKEPPAKAGAPAWPFHLDHSWILSPAGLRPETVRALGAVLVALVIAGFAVTGVGLLLDQGWWRPVGIGAAALSALQLILYFNPWLSAGVGIDVAVGVAALAGG